MRVHVSRRDGDIPDGYVCLGELLAHFGLRGELKSFFVHPDLTLFNKTRTVTIFLRDGSQEVHKLSIRSEPGKD